MRSTKSRFLWLLLLPFSAYAQVDTSGLQYSVAADIVGKLGLNRISTPPSDRDRLLVRETELSFFGPIDHIFDGTVTAAAHFEDGESNFELHEAYVSTTKVVGGLQLKGGLFMLGVGRLNRIHRHDWPFTYAPLVQQNFFDTEAAIDTGLEASYLLPVPFYLNISGGITSGFTYGHSHSAGERPLTPTHYSRLSTYQDLSGELGVEAGLNYLGRKSAAGNSTTLFGVDFIAKKTEGKITRFLFQGEGWHSRARSRGGVVERKLGSYIFPQYGLKQFLWGLRLDTFSHLNKTNAVTGQRENNITYAFTPTMTFKPSEFTTFRFSYGYSAYKELSETMWIDRILSLQITFILGAHPAHLF